MYTRLDVAQFRLVFSRSFVFCLRLFIKSFSSLRFSSIANKSFDLDFDFDTETLSTMFIFDLIAHFFSAEAVLSRKQLDRLAAHKYKSTNTSILDPIFKNFWEWLVLQYPAWWAPNVLTTASFVINMCGFLALAYYSPDAKQETPPWTCFFACITVFLYQCLDATDGMQARLTGTSSPLGELFDHGCDALCQVFVSLQVCICLRVGEKPELVVLCVLLAVTVFYCTHWQTFATGVLQFQYFDVTESLTCVMAISLITGFFGGDFWSKEIFGLPLKYYVLVLSCIGIGITTFSCMQTILTSGAGKDGSTVADTSIIFPIIPLMAIILPTIWIYNRSPSTVLVDHIVLFCICCGLVSAKLTIKIIVAYMTRSAIDVCDTILWGPFGFMANYYFNMPIPEIGCLYIFLVYGIIDLGVYVWVLVDQICDYLNISCFCISLPDA